MAKASFSANSSNFWVNVLNFILATIAIAGVQLPANPNSISLDIINTLNTSGVIAVIGMVVLNVASPIYHAFIKNSFNLKGVLGSRNFWVQAGTLAVSALMLVQIEIPTGSVEQIVGAIYAKDYASLLTAIFLNVINPLIRWFKDRKTTDPLPA